MQHVESWGRIFSWAYRMQRVCPHCAGIIVFLLFGSAFAQTSKVLDVIGEGYPVEEALANARDQALRQSGIRLLSTFSEIESGSKSGVSTSRQVYTAALSQGLIAAEEELERKLTVRGEPPHETPVYQVKLRVKVASIAQTDPYFQLTLNLKPQRSFYRDGEDVTLELDVTKDCYVTVFSVGADNNLYLVFPNLNAKDNYLKAHSSRSIEGLTMHLPKEMEKAAEHIVAIATKENFPFVDNDNNSNVTFEYTGDGHAVALSCEGAATKLAEWLGKLGEDQWTLARLPYSIAK